MWEPADFNMGFAFVSPGRKEVLGFQVFNLMAI
jgi:hypothetical protein